MQKLFSLLYTRVLGPLVQVGLVVLGLTALSDSISVYIGPSPREREKEERPVVQKLTTSLVNVSLKFQTLISQISRYFLLKKCVKLLHCKSFSHFFQLKISVHLVIKS